MNDKVREALEMKGLEDFKHPLNKLFRALRNGVQRKYFEGTSQHAPDILGANINMKEASVVLAAIFDPENQPSQFGTSLAALASEPGVSKNELSQPTHWQPLPAPPKESNKMYWWIGILISIIGWAIMWSQILDGLFSRTGAIIMFSILVVTIGNFIMEHNK